MSFYLLSPSSLQQPSTRLQCQKATLKPLIYVELLSIMLQQIIKVRLYVNEAACCWPLVNMQVQVKNVAVLSWITGAQQKGPFILVQCLHL